MLEFFSNPVVQIISGYIGGILTAIIFHILSIKRKPKLEWGVISHSPVLMNNGNVNKLIKITYEDKLLDNLSVTNIYLINRGKQSLRKNDVAKPVRFIFSKGVKIIDFINFKGNNGTIRVTIDAATEKEQHYLQVDFDYLNPNQGIWLYNLAYWF